MTTKPMKNGKLPSSSNSVMEDLLEFASESILDVDPKVKKHLEAGGKTLRWINATKFKHAGGFSSNGWSPVRTADIPKEVLALSTMAFGSTAEGFIVRNDMMLAQRSQEMTERHERKLRASAALKSGSAKINANAIKEKLGKYGKVIEGYDENGDD